MYSINGGQGIDWIKRLANNFKGPICRICETENAKYDMTVCDKCESAIKRLKRL